MNSVFEIILTGIGVAVVLAATYFVTNRVSQNRVARDFDNPADVLAAVEVYLRYGRERAAVALLEGAVEKYPDNAALCTRLDDLKRRKTAS
jgi:hypothetical protein